ncbi:hypothetical protein DPMN_062191 [Dreissena polymorpha]|uniref:Uncharacterized protein n=1 Tax=Dreissena polymorpha TaxID=45954 RepID=A0A9D4HJ33_DREPO|nr:hypothetical protein DPMN_062191 [Dreissena polymorpha]
MHLSGCYQAHSPHLSPPVSNPSVRLSPGPTPTHHHQCPMHLSGCHQAHYPPNHHQCPMHLSGCHQAPPPPITISVPCICQAVTRPTPPTNHHRCPMQLSGCHRAPPPAHQHQCPMHLSGCHQAPPLAIPTSVPCICQAVTRQGNERSLWDISTYSQDTSNTGR